jgi:hypothetical protein
MRPTKAAIHEVDGNGGAQVLDLLEKPLVRRVIRRMPTRIVRFDRSTYDVLILDSSGEPPMTRTVSDRRPAG